MLDELDELAFGEDLLQRFVVDEAGAVLGDLKLALLEMLTEFPGCQYLTLGLLR